jgi:hypothetical protein
MSFSRMKPLPKFLILGSIVGGLGFGIHLFLESRPKAPVTEALKVETTTVPAEGTPAAAQAAEAAKPAPAPAPVADAAPAPALTPATPSDAGLANVLGSKK